MIAMDQNWHEDHLLLKKLEPYYLYSEWKRSYPGCSGKGNVKLNYYNFNVDVIKIFKEYHSFLETGYDIVFYQNHEIVLTIIFHEYCYYVGDKYKKNFADLMKQSDEDCFGDIQPEIPEFAEEVD